MARAVELRIEEARSGGRAAVGKLVVRRAEKWFDGRRALGGVDIELPDGTVTCVIGPSGSGKTTLLKSINLLHLIDAGEIWYRGQLVVRAQRNVAMPRLRSVAHLLLYGTRKRLASRRELHVTPHVYRRQVALVFQEFNLWPSLTVLENLIMGPLHAKGERRRVAEDRARELLTRVGLPDVGALYPGELSGGQRQRVAIVRALMMDPDVLLLDEVTSALDPELVGEVLAVLRDLARRGVTMLIVTHHMEFARDIADRVVMMDDGRIIEAGTPREVLETPSHPRTRRFLDALSAAR